MNYTIAPTNLVSYYKCPWLYTKFRYEDVEDEVESTIKNCIKSIFIYQFVHERWPDYRTLKTKWEKAMMSIEGISIPRINDYNRFLLDTYNEIMDKISNKYNVIAIDMPCEFISDKYIYVDKADVLLVSHTNVIVPVHFCNASTLLKRDNKIRFLNAMLADTLNVNVEYFWYIQINKSPFEHLGKITISKTISNIAKDNLKLFLNSFYKCAHLPNTDYCDKCPCRKNCKIGYV